MKKIAAFFIALIFIGCMTACSAAPQTATAENTASVSPAQPSQSKDPIEKVFGKKIKIAAVSNTDDKKSEWFFSGVKQEAEALGAEVQTNAAKDNYETEAQNFAEAGVDALIVFLYDPDDSYDKLEAIAKDIPVSVFEMEEGGDTSSISRVTYNAQAQVDMALEATLAYPPHDTPVRLISMFENNKAQAFATFKTNIDNGKIYNKAQYVVSEDKEKTADVWIKEKLDRFVEGMIDAVFAEDEELAIHALDQLEAAKRTDMEVFCIGMSSELVERMQKNPEVVPQAIGANSVFAGVLNVRIVLDMLKGAQSVKEEMKPSIINASDLKDKDTVAFLSALVPDGLTKDYNETWMDELRAANKK
jgi:DNA-binding LacI/PurR family transcriptional regulator